MNAALEDFFFWWLTPSLVAPGKEGLLRSVPGYVILENDMISR